MHNGILTNMFIYPANRIFEVWLVSAIYIFSSIQFRMDGHFGKINIILPLDVAETSGSNFFLENRHFLNPQNFKKDQSE